MLCFLRRGNNTFLKVLWLGSVCVSREANLRVPVCYWLFPTGKGWTKSGFIYEHKPVGDTTALFHKIFQNIIPCSTTYRKQILWSIHGVMCKKSPTVVYFIQVRETKGATALSGLIYYQYNILYNEDYPFSTRFV